MLYVNLLSKSSIYSFKQFNLLCFLNIKNGIKTKRKILIKYFLWQILFVLLLAQICLEKYFLYILIIV